MIYRTLEASGFLGLAHGTPVFDEDICKRPQSDCPIWRIRSCSILPGSVLSDNPSLWLTRPTWVSTAMRPLYEKRYTNDVGGLPRDSRKRISDSISAGTLPPNSENDHARRGDHILRLIAVKTVDRISCSKTPIRRPRNPRHPGIFEKGFSDHIDPLSVHWAEICSDQQFQRVFIPQHDHGFRVTFFSGSYIFQTRSAP
jgi:hypothetical protein